ncbi:MAG: hypothetical protein ACTSW2_07700 [Alphaproteobacteria bacterium]
MRKNFAGSGVARAGLFHLALFALVLVTVFVPGDNARAALVLGDHLGTFSGNDSESALLSELGLQVTELAKVETPATSTDGLTLSNIIFNDDDPPEPISGQWDFSGAGLVDIIVVKAGQDYAVFLFSDTNTSNMRNTGLWSTLELGGIGMSHITAYQLSAVPLPAALPLLGSALATFGFVGWRRRKRAETAKAAAA